MIVERDRLIAALRRLFAEPGATASEPVPNLVFTAPDVPDAGTLRRVIAERLPAGLIDWDRDPAGSLARFAFTRSFNLPVALAALPELCSHPAIAQVEPGGPGAVQPTKVEGSSRAPTAPPILAPALERFFAEAILPVLAKRNLALARGHNPAREGFLRELARLLDLPLPGIGVPLAVVERIENAAGHAVAGSGGVETSLADRFAAAALESWRPARPGTGLSGGERA